MRWLGQPRGLQCLGKRRGRLADLDRDAVRLCFDTNVIVFLLTGCWTSTVGEPLT